MYNIKQDAWPAHTIQSILIWMLSGIIVAWQFILQLSIGAIAEDLRISFKLSALELGLLSSSFYYMYVLMQIPMGALIDKFGTRQALSYGLFVCCLGCLLFASTSNYYLAIVGRILMGAGTSCAFVAAINISSTWFPIKYAAFLIGLVQTLGILGAFIGNIAVAYFASKYNWQFCFKLATTISGVLALMCLLLLKAPPTKKQFATNLLSAKQILKNLLELIKIKKIWLNGTYIGFIYTIVTVFTALWGGPFLIKAYYLDPTMAALFISFILVGVGVGAPITGGMFGVSKYREQFLAGSAFVAFCTIGLIIYMPSLNWYLLTLCCFILGITAGSTLIGFIIASELAPRGAASMSVGFTNTLGMITAPILQPLIGYILNCLVPARGTAEISNYTSHDFKIALSILPVLFFIAIFIALKLRLRPSQY